MQGYMGDITANKNSKYKNFNNYDDVCVWAEGVVTLSNYQLPQIFFSKAKLFYN